MLKRFLLLLCLLPALLPLRAQWVNDGGHSFYRAEKSSIVQYTLPDMSRKIIVDSVALTPAGAKSPLPVRSFTFSNDGNTKRVAITGCSTAKAAYSAKSAKAARKPR